MESKEKRTRKGVKKPNAEEEIQILLRDFPELQSLENLQRTQAEGHRRTIFDEMPGGFFIYEARGNERLTYANQAMVRLMGCESLEEFYEFTGQSFRGIVHPDDYELVEKSIWEQIEASQDELDYVEYRVAGKDGRIRWIDDYGHYVKTDDGQEFFYVFVSDATDKHLRERRAREAMLEAANAELLRRLRIIEAFSRDYTSIFYADLTQNMIQTYQCNSQIGDLFRVGETIPFDGFAEVYINTWVHPDDRAAMRRATDPTYIRQRCALDWMYHVNYRMVDGNVTRYMLMRVVDVSEDHSGSQLVLGYRLVDDEIRQELERRALLEAALDRAKTAAAAKATFLANMSHDIRTPMNAVVGYSTLIRRNLTDRKKLLEYLDHIDNASERMLQLIQNVLELSEMESGDSQLQIAPCDLCCVMEEVAHNVRHFAWEKGVALSVDLSGVKNRAVYCDEKKLTLVMDHLLNNAIQYTDQGGQVSAILSQQGPPTRDYASYTLEVIDNGLGIDPANLSRIFEPFERQQNTTISGIPGVGLGLTIVKSIVELMGGTIEVKSTQGEGSTFTVTVALRVQKEEAAAPKAAPREEKAGAEPPRVLVVDDNELNLELCCELLRESGFLVESAVNGQEALDLVASSKPGYYSLVLMDIQMPVMDGNEASRAIRALPDPALASIPIVALSANALESDRKKSMQSGMNAHLAKPFQLDELLRYLDNFGRD